MNEDISIIYDYFVDLDPAYMGYVLGCATFVLAIIIVKIINAAFAYPKKSPGIKIPEENGSLYITSKAIADLINTMDSSFLKVTKVLLWDHKSYLALEINIEFDLKGGNLPEIGGDFKKELFKKLEFHFGIDSIRDINITTKKASQKSNSKF